MNWSGAKNLVAKRVTSVMWDRINHGVAHGQEPVSIQSSSTSTPRGSMNTNSGSATSYNGCWMRLERRHLKQSPNLYSM